MSNTLSNFTDILSDEIENSQPISLPSSTSSHEVIGNITSPKNIAGVTNRPAKGTGQYGEFRSVEEIDPKYRNIFTYSFFNVVQSRVIDDALYSDKSLVICAPTGSGKTVIFEMAIVHLLMSLDDKKYTGDFKIVYMAPVKALCTERLTEWYPKFTKHGLLCIEVTGDTDVDFSQLKPYRIIITTPEKWDMLTRRWRDHKSLVEVIKLFLIDEVHILNDETRGPVLEAVVSRMKTIESSVQSTHRIEQIQKQCEGSLELSGDAPRIRFVAVSATVSNPEDVASWLGTEDKPAAYYKFGDECRPVKLKRVVEGFPCAEGTSIFKFDIILNYKLWPIIQKYHDGKPTLIFCNTRKSVVLTAETLSKELTINFNPEQKARLIALASTIKTKKLQSLIMSGVGCHHAGMLFEERINIEQAFRNRDLPILITTTTLAMGVNLPAHLVIIKNTQQYVNGAYQEYSISTVLQMVGRAGRPQYDTEATAVIMTRLADKHRYQALVGGNEPLQSFLHKRLPENLNSEAALGTVGDVAQCVQWLRSTFLFVRSARDPRRYLGLPPSAPQPLISKKIEVTTLHLMVSAVPSMPAVQYAVGQEGEEAVEGLVSEYSEELCVKAMNGLATSGLITMDEASCIESTDAGRLMSIYYLDVETMKNIMKIDGTETLERLLAIVCDSHEMSDMHLRVDERRCLNALNRNNTAATIRFPMKGKINTRQMKLNCIIQAILGCLPITDPSLNQEAMKVMRVADRICKCLVAYVTRPDLISQQPKHFSAILNSIILAKCVTAHLWENSPFVSKQLKGIGPAFSTLLATAGKVNFMLLKESHPRDLERIMNKGPPAGNTLRKQISLLPQYSLTITPRNERTISIRLVLENLCYLSENMECLTAGEAHKSYIIVGDSDNYLLLLTSFKDKDLISIYDGTITYEITRKRNCEHKIFAHCVSSNFVGIDVQCEFVFEDLEPPPNINIDTITKNLNHKQTYITDIFKERKRKNEDNLKTPQSKEKRRRDSTIIQKFTELKEPFNQTFQILNKTINGEKIAPDISCVTYKKNPSNNKTQMIPIEQNSYIKNNNANSFNLNNMTDLSVSEIHLGNSDEDITNDEKINSLLDSIESEICEVNKLPKIQTLSSKPTQSTIYQNKKTLNYGTPPLNIHKKDVIRQTTERFPSKLETHRNMQTKARKTKNVKSNYSFIDILERKVDCVDEKDNTIIATDNAIGFSSTIKTNIDKYLATIHQSSTDSDVHEMLLPNTKINNYLIPNTDIASQHISPQSGVNTSESGTNLDINCETLGEQSMTTQITTTIKSMDNMNQKNKNFLLKESTTESPQKITLDDKITKSIDLRDDNTLIGSLQENSSTVTIQQKDTDVNKSIIRPESIPIDANINYGVLNPICNYISENSRTQNNDFAANFKYKDKTNVEGKFFVPNEPEFVDSNKIKQLSSNLSNVGNYVYLTDCLSKYSFKSTTVSVKSSSDNLVQIIKKLKVNLDITQNISTNKLLNIKGINATCPTIYRTVEKANNCMISENNKIIDHYELTPTKSNKIENTMNDVQTMPKCTDKELQTKQTISALDNNCKETMCDANVRFYENAAEGQECRHNSNTAKGLPDVTLTKRDEVYSTNLTTEIDQYTKIATKKCEDNNIADILKKYSTMIRNNNKDQDINNNGSTIRKQNKTRQETRIPDRPFKICDIQKLDINLPQPFVNETPTDININNYYNFVSELPIIKSNDHQNEGKYIDVHTVTSLNSAEHAENIQTNNFDKIYLEDEDNELIWPASVEYPQEPTAEFNIHDSMFDPKTLLQCLDNDKNDVIIPPPPEFRDNVNFNYSTEEIISDTYSPKARVENHIESENSCIFSDYDFDLTPCEETETLILSPEMSCDSSSIMSSDTGQSCITTDRSFPSSKEILHNPPFARLIKLNQFKFSQKKKMKI